uniref:Putative alpha-L-fucosidase n=1 Tax=Globodera rostochiensis TaxID=31243 RepID=A0A914GRJ3_GLORO
MFAIAGLLVILFCSFQAVLSGYKPDWASIDSRPLPVWYDEAKFGIFSHWGVYSVPAFGSEWFWWYWKGQHDPKYEQFVEKHYPNGTTYADFAKFFTAADFDANNYAEIVKASGARYFVLTSKHHEGFTLWPSTTSWNWNAVDVGPHRDLVKAFSEATRAQNVHFGLYFSLFDWFHPLYLNDIKTHRTDFVQSVSFPQLLEIVNEYHPEVIWSDGDWEQPDTYWRSKEFLAWLYNESPVKEKVVVNDRWGRGISGKHGGFLTYQDHYDPGRLLSRKWENCLTLDKRSWGYRRYLKPSDVLSLAELISQLARTISCGGNMLLNVGPDHTGRIVPIFEQRLREFGQWVTRNTEAIYGSKAWVHQSDGPTIWYTSQMRNSTELSPHRMYNPQETFNTIVYAFMLSIPRTGRIKFPSVHLTDKTVVSIVGTSTKVPYKKGETSLSVDISGIPWQDLPSTVSIVLKIEFAASSQINPLRTATESDSSGDDDDASSIEEANNAVSGKENSALRTRGQDEGRRYGQMMELVSATDE